MLDSLRDDVTEPSPCRRDGFEEFVRTDGARLRKALVARHGLDEGCDLAAEALGYGYEHWDRLATMANPVGYLYRVAENAGRKRARWRRAWPFRAESAVSDALPVDADLQRALARLRPAHRASVVLVHCFGWSYDDTATALGVPVSTVRNHVHRGLTTLRDLLERP